jgi:hypothetical protein
MNRAIASIVGTTMLKKNLFMIFPDITKNLAFSHKVIAHRFFKYL